MRILLIGEVCVDEFVYGKCDRICQEAAVPIFVVENVFNVPRKIRSQGMCANVFRNIKSLREDISIDLISNENEIVKTRLMDTTHNSIVYRIDENDAVPPINLEMLPNSKFDAVVVSDYDKGFLSNSDLLFIASKYKCPKFIDTKKIIQKEWGPLFDFIKINSYELKNNLQAHWDIGTLLKTVRTLIVTKGKDGSSLYTNSKTTHFDPVKVKAKNVSGAGDTFLAALVVQYLDKYDIEESIRFANMCAALAVQKDLVSTVSYGEINNLKRSDSKELEIEKEGVRTSIIRS